MRSDYIRIYKSVHTWTGIISGMALFIAFYAGALTVFKEPLTRWASPPNVMTTKVPLADAQDLILKTLAAQPNVAKDFAIQLESLEHVPVRMAWEVRGSQGDNAGETAVHYFTAALDASGSVQTTEIHPSTVAEFIDVLHRVVGLPFDNDPNRWIMGVIAALYAVALISGVIVLLPSLVKDFFALRVGKNRKRMWLDAHNMVGIISLPFHIVMALTAVAFAFHDQIYGVQDKVVHQGKWASAFQRSPSAPDTAPPRDPSNMLSPLEIVAKLRTVSPSFEPNLLQYQQVMGSRAVVRVWGKDDSAVSPRAQGGFAALDPYSGKVVSTDYMPGQQSTPNLFVSSFFALHMASFGGIAVQWMYFLLGLAGAWLFYSGNLLWVETRRRRAVGENSTVPVQRLDTRLMASATVGVCLGSISGISLMLVASKCLYGQVANLATWIQLVYYAAFFSAIAWAFLRGAAQAAVHLLWVAAISTLAMPITSLLAWLAPGLGLWAYASAASAGVDVTAFLGALCFGWMARATARRVQRGATDSVWSTCAPPLGANELRTK